jgi:hypothetical protein
MTFATPKEFRLMHLTPRVMALKKSVAGNWFNVPNCKGVINAIGNTQPNGFALTNVIETPLYATLTVNGAGYTATTTSIVYDGATCTFRQVPYYVKTSCGEIMEVTADSGSTTIAGTLTVRRGCLGTTAVAGDASGVLATAGGVQDNAMLSVLNTLIVGATIGFTIVSCLELPQDAGTKLFA